MLKPRTSAAREMKRRRKRERARDEVARTSVREGARETMIDMSSLSNNHQFLEFTVAEYTIVRTSTQDLKEAPKFQLALPNDLPGIDDLISDQARSTKVLDEKVHEEILESCGIPGSAKD